jgi:hypothetical protein
MSVSSIGEERMTHRALAESRCSATIHAPIEYVDLPDWCFTLSESEYQSCSPAHYFAGATAAPDGRRMSINVEVLGGSLIVQHYVEEVARPDHLRLVSNSDLFTPTGRTKIAVRWDLCVRKIDDQTCEFTNSVHSSVTSELGWQGSRESSHQGARDAGDRESGADPARVFLPRQDVGPARSHVRPRRRRRITGPRRRDGGRI